FQQLEFSRLVCWKERKYAHDLAERLLAFGRHLASPLELLHQWLHLAEPVQHHGSTALVQPANQGVHPPCELSGRCRALLVVANVPEIIFHRIPGKVQRRAEYPSNGGKRSQRGKRQRVALGKPDERSSV